MENQRWLWGLRYVKVTFTHTGVLGEGDGFGTQGRSWKQLSLRKLVQHRGNKWKLRSEAQERKLSWEKNIGVIMILRTIKSQDKWNCSRKVYKVRRNSPRCISDNRKFSISEKAHMWKKNQFSIIRANRKRHKKSNFISLFERKVY